MSTKPTILPLWATNPVVGGVITPSAAKQQRGWVPGERPPAQYMNWILVNTYLWLKWISDGDVSWNSSTVAHNMTIGTNAADTLVVNSTATFNNSVTFASIVVNAGAAFNGNVTLGDAGGDVLTVNATSTFQDAITANNSLTVQGNFVANGNTTIGNAGSDTLTVVAASTFSTGASFTSTVGISGALSVSGTSNFTGAITFNANATLSSGKTITLTDGAAALKGYSRILHFGMMPINWQVIGGSVAVTGNWSSQLSASFTGWMQIPGIGGHETLTGLVLFCTGSAPNVSSIELWRSSPGSGASPLATQVTGITFSASGTTDTIWTMTGSPSPNSYLVNTTSSADVFYLKIVTSAGGTTIFNSMLVGLTT